MGCFFVTKTPNRKIHLLKLEMGVEVLDFLKHHLLVSWIVKREILLSHNLFQEKFLKFKMHASDSLECVNRRISRNLSESGPFILNFEKKIGFQILRQ